MRPRLAIVPDMEAMKTIEPGELVAIIAFAVAWAVMRQPVMFMENIVLASAYKSGRLSPLCQSSYLLLCIQAQAALFVSLLLQSIRPFGDVFLLCRKLFCLDPRHLEHRFGDSVERYRAHSQLAFGFARISDLVLLFGRFCQNIVFISGIVGMLPNLSRA